MTDREIYEKLVAQKGVCPGMARDCNVCPSFYECGKSMPYEVISEFYMRIHQHAKEWLANNPADQKVYTGKGTNWNNLKFDDGRDKNGTDIASNNSEASAVKCSCDIQSIMRNGCQCGGC